MNYEQLWDIGEQARHGAQLTPGEKSFIVEVVPRELAKFPNVPVPSRVRHPAGFSLSGAPVRTLTRCVLVLSARRVLGPNYDARSEFYQRVAADLAFGIMRSHFHHEYPKGVHCCAQCTLAVYPVLKAKALRWFDCHSLAEGVRRLIEEKQWRFSGATNPLMIGWALAEKE
jgi:hypothetical protein